MQKINIRLTSDFTPSSGLSTTIGWKRLLPAIQKAIGLKKSEEVTGFIVDGDGIQVRLKQK